MSVRLGKSRGSLMIKKHKYHKMINDIKDEMIVNIFFIGITDKMHHLVKTHQEALHFVV